MKMKFKLKKKRQTPPRFEPRAMASEAIAKYAMSHANIAYQTIKFTIYKGYHSSKYKSSMFSAIFRHKQPQNVDLKLLVLLK